jgi:Fe-S-cluster containining protein
MGCSKCGKCCKELGANMWKLSPLFEGMDLSHVIDTDGCLFLSKDNACIIQQVWGVEMKPKACTEYPFGEKDNRCRFNTDYQKNNRDFLTYD